MKLVQVYDSEGEPVALYNCTDPNLTEEDVEALIKEAQQRFFIEDDENEQATDDWLETKGLFRVYIDYEIYLI